MTAKELLLKDGYVDINSKACLCTDEWLVKEGHIPSYDKNRTWIVGNYEINRQSYLICLCNEDIATHFFTIGEDKFFINLHLDKQLNAYTMLSLFTKLNDINLQEL